jgi:hypothetical protein
MREKNEKKNSKYTAEGSKGIPENRVVNTRETLHNHSF